MLATCYKVDSQAPCFAFPLSTSGRIRLCLQQSPICLIALFPQRSLRLHHASESHFGLPSDLSAPPILAVQIIRALKEKLYVASLFGITSVRESAALSLRAGSTLNISRCTTVHRTSCFGSGSANNFMLRSGSANDKL